VKSLRGEDRVSQSTCFQKKAVFCNGRLKGVSPIYRQLIMTIINGSLIRTVGLNDRTSVKVQWKADAWSVASGSIEDAGLQPPAPVWH